MNRQQRRAAAKHGNAQGGSSGQSSGVAELLAAGVRHHQAGQLPEAEKNYRLALDLQPDQPDALHLLGVLAIQVRRHDVAAELIGRAVRLNAKNPGYHANLALALQHQGKFVEALNSLDQALALASDHVEALNSRGNVLMKLKRFTEALASYDRLVALKPDLPEAFHNRGRVLQQLGRLDDALGSYQRAVGLSPGLAEAHSNSGAI